MLANKLHRLILSLAALVMLACAPIAASAQTVAPPAGQSVSKAELESLLASIEDPAQRDRLVSQLKALIAAQTPQKDDAEPIVDSLIGGLSHRLANASQSVVNAVNFLRDLPKVQAWLQKQVQDPIALERWRHVLLNLAAALAVGWAAEWLGRAILSAPRRRVTPDGGEGVIVRSLLVFLSFFLELLPLAAFGAAVYGSLTVLEAPATARVVCLTVANAYLVSRVVMALASWLLTPPNWAARLHKLDEETAQYLFIWVRRFVLVTAIGYFIVEALLTLGLPRAGYVGLLKVLGLVVWAMTIVLILQNRAGVATAIAGDPEADTRFAGIRRRLADIWHPLAIIYAVALYAIWAFEIKGGFAFMVRGTLATVIALVAANLINRGLVGGSKRLFAVRDDLRARFPGLEARANRYVPVLLTILQVLVWVCAALAIASGWGFDVAGWVEDGFGRRIFGSAFSILLVLIAATILWEGSSAAITRYMTRTDAEGKLLQRSSRARSLLPVLRNLIFVVLATMVTLIVMSEVGINIAPLLAGAGVVGLAIGFGAQTLVKDVITGAFILFEDSVAVGDVVKVGEFSGVVEAMSIRSMRLRDFNGNAHTVPFSVVNQITNMTKDFSYYAFDLGVAYREDTDEVSEVLRQIGREMMEDPTVGPMIMEPLEVVGVDKLADSAVIIKGRIKTYPIKQWTVGRELNRRIKKRFDELGIEIPFPHTTIYFGEDKKGSAPPANLRIQRDRGQATT